MADDVRVDLQIDKGESWSVQLYWTDQYDEALSVTNPMRMMVKSGVTLINTYISVSDAPTGGQLQYISFNTETGFIQISLPSSHTNTLTPGIYQYDLFAEIEDPDDLANPTKRTKVIGGEFIVAASTTTF
jgi:hypothetical protein